MVVLGGPRGGAAAVRLVLRAQQVVENVHDGRYVALGLAVGVLQGGVEGAGEGARVHALAVVVHRFDDGAPRAAAAATLAGAPLPAACGLLEK